jgi:hypothetical protein
MQSINLPLFELDNQNLTSKRIQPPKEISEEKVIIPLTQVLEHISPNSLEKPKQSLDQTPSFNQALNNLFPEQLYDDKEIQKAKEILGSITAELTPQQLEVVIAEVKYLAETWLDDFEREVFQGQTLKELLHNKT